MMTGIPESVQLAVVTGAFAILSTLLTLIFRVLLKTHEAVNSRLDAMLERASILEDEIRDSGGIVPPRDTTASTPPGNVPPAPPKDTHVQR